MGVAGLAGVAAFGALGAAGLYPLAVLSVAILSYAVGSVVLHVSGFAAVYVTSLILGRAELPHDVQVAANVAR